MHQRAAWWVEIPRQQAGSVRIRFRNITGSYDYRLNRQIIRMAEEEFSEIWQQLTNNPVQDLARLLWQEQGAQTQIEKSEQHLIDLKRSRRRGELNQRDFEADERNAYFYLDRWQNVSAQSVERYDRLLRDVVEAMPRPSRERYRTRILALVDRLLNDPMQRQKWHADQWDEECLSWRIRSGGGTSTKIPVTAMGLSSFKMITLQPRRGFAGSEGATSAFREPSRRYG